MRDLHVLVTIPFDEATLARWEALSSRIALYHRPVRSHTDIAAETWEKAEVFYTAGIYPPSEAMPNLKWLQSHSAGVDSVLQQPLVRNKPDLLITSTRGIHATNIGEYVIGMFLALGHRMPQLGKAQIKKLWEDDRHERYVPKELRGSTVGIVGYGALGREIARLSKAFGAQVLAAKRDAKSEKDREGFVIEGTGDPEGELFDRLYPAQALATMVKDCDFVVITLPLTEETRGLYSEKVIKAMRHGSFLVNVGRGGVMDEEALLKALKSGALGGAASDVFAQEPLPQDSPFWDMPNFILTPHLAGNTSDYNLKAGMVFEENLRRYIDKRPLMNLVNREAGY